ncbi:LacI family DNA-binding transcriptional regulator [Tannockella kyphosi]|uniref:LacI family DNA-binding transcriptional regulator n=1 Tax=Tannockella kyphosi TaxID=2899121 RepID=UPI002011B639|nr:LacI family DNA-binding transcriptional regulator [Tannockella kyphosi]
MDSEKKITIKEIAEMSGVSKTTVSFYLNGKTEKMSLKTKKKIEDVINETQYSPSVIARTLNSKSSKLLGVIIGDITNTFSNQIVKGIEIVAEDKGYQIIVGNSDYRFDREETYVDRMISMGVDGFIIQPTARFRKISKKIESLGKPMVFFDSKLFDIKTNWVKTNNYEVTYDTIHQCVEKGYEKFYMITANPQLISTRLERNSGFLDALDDSEIEYDVLTINEDEEKPENIANFLNERLDFSKKNLIFVPNCWALPTVFLALKDHRHHMPNLGLVGFDNLEWVNFSSPTITTIIQPAIEEGVEVAKILIDKIEDSHEVPEQQVLDCCVIWNESTL